MLPVEEGAGFDFLGGSIPGVLRAGAQNPDFSTGGFPPAPAVDLSELLDLASSLRCALSSLILWTKAQVGFGSRLAFSATEEILISPRVYNSMYA